MLRGSLSHLWRVVDGLSMWRCIGLVWFGFGLAWFWFGLVEWKHRGDTTIDDPIGLDWIGRGVAVGM